METRRFVTGYVVNFGEAVISWKSNRQSTVSRSSTEAEFRSMATTIAKLVWLKELFSELGVEVTLPIQLFCDSKVSIQIANHPIFHERTKHIDIYCHFLRVKKYLKVWYKLNT